MGRHSRKGPAPTGRGADDRTTTAAPAAPAAPGTPGAPGGGRRRRTAPEAGRGTRDPQSQQARQAQQGAGDARDAQGFRAGQAPQAPWDPQAPHGPAPQQYGYGYGFGTPAQGAPSYGTPAHGTPAHGTPPHGTPAHDAARDVRGGHPEQREPGGAWGTGPYTAAGAPQAAAPQPRIAQGPPRIPGPRREFVEAFDAPDGQGAQGGASGAADAAGDRAGGTGGPGVAQSSPAGPGDGREGVRDAQDVDDDRDDREDRDETRRGGKGRTFTGIAAAAVTTVLAVVVAGQVGEARQHDRADRAADAPERGAAEDAASRSVQRATPPQSAPSRPAAPPPAYEQLMARQFPLDPGLTASGDFAAIPGVDPAPGKGRKIRYRVDVEKGLGLDGKLFARAVHETLNDDRSWAHGGAMAFERVSTGKPDFVITLASPGTTGVWCAKSGLDTTIDNVSCDSASTDRVMINAYRWAQGAETFGPKAMLAYRQMLINHEVGHRLGHNHRTCQTPGALAPVMQQQTKSLEIDGIKCRPNPWVFPGDD
ncbi:DUF3152 domain-containing protein [Streptomyces thermolilacinus]|uniref:DUF3152 domain-containing protein n=1 Tax=Streptomyces thermolilacinus SPC6 TaxID=1306406 RepID=A0A1D3DQD2_9ACTN|nr:DUF3152 domain-containing protein [Streptomyces thermolilacinus]OEJ94522.1 hypothetical protein J116_008610 [Streptomyces thermolilacinus SPC6]